MLVTHNSGTKVTFKWILKIFRESMDWTEPSGSMLLP